ncbi:MAG: nucleotide-binding domain containing protein, partial [Fusobacteriaceae bacterium]
DISKALGEITKIVLNNNKFCGIFSCGGEVSIEILKSIEAEGVDSLEEVAPLVAYGRIVGGLNPNMQFISKSGEAGEPNILKICIDKLEKN